MQMWVWVDVFVHGFCGCYCVYAFFSLIYKLFLKKYKFTIHFYIFYTVIVNFCFVNLRRLHNYTIFKVNVWSIYKLILICFFFQWKTSKWRVINRHIVTNSISGSRCYCVYRVFIYLEEEKENVLYEKRYFILYSTELHVHHYVV